MDGHGGIDLLPAFAPVAAFEPPFRTAVGLDVVFADVDGDDQPVAEVVRMGELIRAPQLLLRADAPDDDLFFPRNQFSHSSLPYVVSRLCDHG